jgi:hypothetical protein
MKILLISPWGIQDVLTQGYVLPYIPLIQQSLLHYDNFVEIHLVTLEKKLLSSTSSEILLGGASLHYPLYFRGPSPKGYLDLIASLIKGSFIAIRTNYTFIQSWCATGGSIGYVLSLISRTPLILDSYEPHADAMAETGCWNPGGFKYKLLKSLEIRQATRASAFFPVSPHMYSYSRINYKVDINGRAVVKPACVSLSSQNTYLQCHDFSESIKGIYVGKFGGLYLDVDFFRILRCAQHLLGDRFSFTILSCQDLTIIERYASIANFDISSIHIDCVPHDCVPEYLSSAHYAITSLKSVPSRLCCTPVKTGEYWAWGLPVLSTPGISVDSDIIESNQIGIVLKDLSEAQIITSLRKLYSLIELNRDGHISNRIRSISLNSRGLHLAQSAYESVYDSFFDKRLSLEGIIR